ncbi:MAG: hypothetical protein F4X67_14225 [Gemmatimonadales bacterium]|nr:hypothetical protein [Gemmatimonadales bacterium]
MENDIALMAWIEQRVLALAGRQGSLRESARQIEREYSLEPGHLGDGLIWQTRVMSLMYMLILHPREHWGMEEGDLIYAEIRQRWSPDGVEVITPERHHEDRVYGFIHRLRNAIAHAHVTFRGDDMEFWDVWNGKEAYRARLTRSEVERFLGTVGAIMANRRNSPRH